VYGTLLVNFAKTSFSESFPELWLFAMGALFIGVVMAFPNGLAGIYQTYIEPRLTSNKKKTANDTTPPEGKPMASASNTEEKTHA
jgi:urea transport system permease protein